MADQLQGFPVSALKGVGPKMAEALTRLSLFSVQDLLFHLPFRYEDRTKVYPLNKIKSGDRVLVEGRVVDVKVTGARQYLRVTIANDLAQCDLVFFHYAKGHQQKLSNIIGDIRCFGEVRRSYAGGLEIVHPEYVSVESIKPDSVLATSDRLSPIYPTTKGLPQNTLRKLVQQTFSLVDRGAGLQELLPVEFLQSFDSFSLIDALRFVHFPPVGIDEAALRSGTHPAIQRLAFEELIAYQLGMQTLRHRVRQCAAPVLSKNIEKETALLSSLPFTLTGAQQRVCDDIAKDLTRDVPMLRLVQGDVGSGKTIVSCCAVLQAVSAGFQVAIMAPTEILSNQHMRHFTHWLAPLGVSMVQLTGKQKRSDQEDIKTRMASGEVDVVIGTHALFQVSVAFKKLGLLVIDEQHRFGVHQRLALLEKGFQDGQSPHQLIMTATPIPRTLAMTLYADLDCSVIDELPPGRQPITTALVSSERRDEVIERVRAACAQGKQAYWICALVEASDVLSCEAAEKTAELLTDVLPGVQVGLVHGRLSSDQKSTVMQAFQSGEVQLLVATTVVEVGVDVPKASLMIIENSERFGLAQLHQLRGRIGRGSEQSFCVLMYQAPLSDFASKRLQAMRESQDGFAIAQYDLSLRGPGEVLGTRQSGVAQFGVADLVRDEALLQQAKVVSKTLVVKYPTLYRPLVQRWLGAQIKYRHA